MSIDRDSLQDPRRLLRHVYRRLRGGARRIPAVTEHTKTCYSHWGEDMVLAHVFEGTDKGRYLDVGCYHPSLASNTKLLHDKDGRA